MVLDGESVIASELFQVEVRNVFWKYVRAGFLPLETAQRYIAQALDLVDEFVPIEQNAAESFVESVRQNHSVYDMLDLTLARRNAATLLTADKKLVALCETMGIDCVHEEEV